MTEPAVHVGEDLKVWVVVQHDGMVADRGSGMQQVDDTDRAALSGLEQRTLEFSRDHARFRGEGENSKSTVSRSLISKCSQTDRAE